MLQIQFHQLIMLFFRILSPNSEVSGSLTYNFSLMVILSLIVNFALT